MNRFPPSYSEKIPGINFKSEEGSGEEDETHYSTDLKLDMISRGDYDDSIVNIFRSLKMDLKKNTTSANWKNQDSSFRILAKNLGLDPENDFIIRELYVVIMFNKRFIRDRIMQRCPFVESGPLKKIDHYRISQFTEEYKLPPPRPETPPKPETPLKSTILKINIPPEQVTPADAIQSSTPVPSTVLPVKTTKSQPEVKSVNWGKTPQMRLCPRCKHQGHTRIQYKIGMCSIAWAFGLFFSGICMACFWFPFALSCTKDVLHICRNCHLILGKVPRNPCTKTEDWDWEKGEEKLDSKYSEKSILAKFQPKKK